MGARPVRILLCGLALVMLCSIAPHPATIQAPRLVLWAWERPEDLRFIDPATTGVAYLAATVGVQPDGRAHFHFRQQQLRVAPGVSLIAVVRIETPARYVFPRPDEIVADLAAVGQQQGVQALQIDYDARASEHRFYLAILDGLRKRIKLPIGITALASWCGSDSWFAGEPLSEAVPMYFRMGPGESKDMPVRARACQSSIGVSTDEAWPQHLPGGRVYVFNPRSWTEADYRAVMQRTGEWK